MVAEMRGASRGAAIDAPLPGGQILYPTSTDPLLILYFEQIRPHTKAPPQDPVKGRPPDAQGDSRHSNGVAGRAGERAERPGPSTHPLLILHHRTATSAHGPTAFPVGWLRGVTECIPAPLAPPTEPQEFSRHCVCSLAGLATRPALWRQNPIFCRHRACGSAGLATRPKLWRQTSNVLSPWPDGPTGAQECPRNGAQCPLCRLARSATASDSQEPGNTRQQKGIYVAGLRPSGPR
jgi:hypothetical protein